MNFPFFIKELIHSDSLKSFMEKLQAGGGSFLHTCLLKHHTFKWIMNYLAQPQFQRTLHRLWHEFESTGLLAEKQFEKV